MRFLFSNPEYLLFLFAIPLMLLIHFVSIRFRKSNPQIFSNFKSLAKIRGIDLYSKNLSISVLTIVIFSLLVFALAGVKVQQDVLSSASSFVIAVDISSSMQADDLVPTRLDAAKETAKIFLDALPSGARVGLISFSGNALIEQEITEDMSLIKGALNGLQISSIGGTDIGEALIASANLLQDEQIKSIILLSDGQITTGNIESAVNYIEERGIVVNTIAVGTQTGGNTGYGFSKADIGSLQNIAYESGGKFFSAESNNELDSAFRGILTLKLAPATYSLAKYLIIISLVLFFIEYAVLKFRYNT